MIKSQLRTGMVAECGNGSKMIVFKGILPDSNVLCGEHTYMDFEDYDDNLSPTHTYCDQAYARDGYRDRVNVPDLEIVKLYMPNDVSQLQFNTKIETKGMTLFWERHKKHPITVNEIEGLLGFEVEIISEK
jgi:hypothetical protein